MGVVRQVAGVIARLSARAQLPATALGALLLAVVVAVVVTAGGGALAAGRSTSGGASSSEVRSRAAVAVAARHTYRGTAIAAHRGAGRQVAGRAVVAGHPEESLPAVRRALAHGDVAELDLRFTSDHEPVAIHDPTTTRTMSCPGLAIAATSLATLRSRCDLLGMRGLPEREIATWEQVLDVVGAYPGSVVVVEIKIEPDAAEARDVVEPILRRGLTDRVVVNSFSPANVSAVTGYAASRGSSLRAGLLTTSSRTKALVRSGATAAATIRRETGAGTIMVAPSYAQITATWVRQLHAAGLQVWAWCPNTAAALRAMRMDRVDVVITDYPDVARTALHAG